MAAPTAKTAQKNKNLLEFLKKLWERDKKIIIQQAVIIGGLVVLICFVFFPLFLKIYSMKTKLTDLDLHIRTAQSKIKKMPVLKQQMELYSKEIELTQKRFRQIGDLDQLVGDLSKLAADSGVRLVGSRPINDKQQLLPEPYNKKYLSASYELTLEGGYHDLGKLLNDIEESERLLLIRDLAVQPSSGKQAEKLQCTIQVDAFVQAPQGLT